MILNKNNCHKRGKRHHSRNVHHDDAGNDDDNEDRAFVLCFCASCYGTMVHRMVIPNNTKRRIFKEILQKNINKYKLIITEIFLSRV